MKLNFFGALTFILIKKKCNNTDKVVKTKTMPSHGYSKCHQMKYISVEEYGKLCKYREIEFEKVWHLKTALIPN